MLEPITDALSVDPTTLHGVSLRGRNLVLHLPNGSVLCEEMPTEEAGMAVVKRLTELSVTEKGVR